jgi:hypothetical protein
MTEPNPSPGTQESPIYNLYAKSLPEEEEPEE